MALAAYDIVISQASAVTVTAAMCSAPPYTVNGVRLVAEPLFTEQVTINDASYYPGDALITAQGGTVTSDRPASISGATTATAAITTIFGSYYTASNTAIFTIPFGATFNAQSSEYRPGGSPREYKYRANFISIDADPIGDEPLVAEQIIAGEIRMAIGQTLRVGGASPNKACSVTQV